MAPTFLPMDNSVVLPVDAMSVESHRLEEDCLFSARGHFEAARTWSRLHYTLGIPAAVLAAVAGGSAFSGWPFLAGFLAMLVSSLAAIITFLNPQPRANQHHAAGAKYNSLRQRVRVFRTVDLQSAPIPSDVRKRLSELVHEREGLSLSSPQIPRPAFERARRGIEQGEANYAIDAD